MSFAANFKTYRAPEGVRNGRPENAKYVGDNDLLPKGHPKSIK